MKEPSNVKMDDALLREKLLGMVSEDMGIQDITAAFTPKKNVSAEIIAKQEGIVSGIEETSILFSSFGISAKALVKDGNKVKKNQRIFLLKGASRDILIVERTALNLLSRMSGISTLTKKYSDEAKKASPKIRVAATRKTAPFLAYFDKKAVKAGGGDTHRLSLSGAVLIKDNHLRLFGKVEKALAAARKETSFACKIEIEVTKPDDAVTAAACGADIILLDNMSIPEIKRSISLLEKNNLRKNVLLEASGGISLESIASYAKTGVDVVSIGRLTHSAPALDMSLEII